VTSSSMRSWSCAWELSTGCHCPCQNP
jgi:hypothetical protein